VSREADRRENLIQQAREVVTSVREAGCDLLGAGIVSSFAAGDFTPASDVDLLMVAADKKGKPGIFRRLVGDRVFEWVVRPDDSLKDVDAILADAALCHDVLTMIILLDADESLGRIQQEVAVHYQKPEWTWKRTTGQLERAARAIEQMQKHAAGGSILPAQRAHVSALKALLAVPRAILNKRLTMARALSFCRESLNALGWPDYMPAILAVLGVTGLSREMVTRLEELAVHILAATEFDQSEKDVRRRHLQGARWLMENVQPADAVWPLCFWSSAIVEESGGDRNRGVWEHWKEFAAVIGVAEKQQLLEKQRQAQQLHNMATSLVETYGRRARIRSV